MERPAALANEVDLEIEISAELYDLVTLRAAELGYTQDELVNDALRTFLLLSGEGRSDALREPGD